MGFFLLPDSPPLLINIKQIANVDSWLESPNNVYIGRYCRGLKVHSPWQNPYKISPTCSRYDVIELYRNFLSENRDLLAMLPRLGNKTLACWCHPLPCHGDVLIQAYVNLPFIEEEEDWNHNLAFSVVCLIIFILLNKNFSFRHFWIWIGVVSKTLCFVVRLLSFCLSRISTTTGPSTFLFIFSCPQKKS